MSAFDFPRVLQPFDPFVVEADTTIFRRSKRKGYCWDCDQPLHGMHSDAEPGRVCWRLRCRIQKRHAVIARFHLYAKHLLTPPDEADRYLLWRDATIEDLAGYGLFFPDAFKSEVAAWRDEIGKSISFHAGFRHLDEGWDGTGWQPSSLAVIRTCMERTLAA